jgi:hypothetical protein
MVWKIIIEPQKALHFDVFVVFGCRKYSNHGRSAADLTTP